MENVLRSLGKESLQSHWEKLSLDPSSERIWQKKSNVFQRIRSLKLPYADELACNMATIRTIRQYA